MKKIIAPLLLSTLACAAQAATITVNNATNGSVSTACTLRDAIASVNNGAYSGGCAASAAGSLGAGDTIEFALPPGVDTIAVEASHIEIRKNLIINAPAGGITLDANLSGSGPGGNRIFYVAGGTSLKITGVRFVDGNAVGGLGGAIGVNTGGHTLTLEQCAFENNQASFGGAVDINYSSSTVIIRNSTFEGNSASGGSGGAVYASTTTISNSTFEGNSATGNGGAVRAGSLNARHLTLLNNTATGGSGQALYVGSGTATLHNSIIIGNSNSAQCASVTFTGSHNLEGWVNTSGAWQASTTTCGSSNPVSIGAASNLSDIFTTTTPVDNGGPTHTLKLSAGSPAIGAADPTTGGTSQMWDFNVDAWTDATLDQRGSPRSAIALGRDLGAYEDKRTSPPSASGTPIPALPVPLLLMLAAAVGAAATVRQRRR